MSFNVDGMLNMEARTGVKSADLDDFLSKVNGVAQAIEDMKAGKIDPADVRVPGVETEDEKAAKEAARRERRKQLEVEDAERRRRQKEEERERWWRGAELLFGPRGGDDCGRGGDGAGSGGGGGASTAAAAEAQKRLQDRYSLEYSRWDTWSPDDPATREEEELRVAAEDRQKCAEFEKNNPDFCHEFSKDARKRAEARETREASGDALRLRGNRFFQARRYPEALKHYMDSLKAAPHRVATLTNVAQAHLKLGSPEDAVEFCDRALHIDSRCIKALSRRATANMALGRRQDAVSDLVTAVTVDPLNEDVRRQHDALQADLREEELEAAVIRQAAAAKEELARVGTGAARGEGMLEKVAAALAPFPRDACLSAADEFEAALSFELVDRLVNEALGDNAGGVNDAGSGPALAELAALLENSQPARLHLRASGGLQRLSHALCVGGSNSNGHIGGEDGTGGKYAAARSPLTQLSVRQNAAAEDSAPASGCAAELLATSIASSTGLGECNVAVLTTMSPKLLALLLRAIAAATDGEARSQQLVTQHGAMAACSAILSRASADKKGTPVVEGAAAAAPAAAVEAASAAAYLVRALSRHEAARLRVAASPDLLAGLVALAGNAIADSAAVEAAAAVIRDVLLGAAAASARKSFANLGSSSCFSSSSSAFETPAAALALGLWRRCATARRSRGKAAPLSAAAGEALCGALANLALHEDFRKQLAWERGSTKNDPAAATGPVPPPAAVLLAAAAASSSGSGTAALLQPEERALALACLMNACAGTAAAAVRATVYSLGGVNVALGGLSDASSSKDYTGGEPAPELRARYAGLLARLAGHPAALKELLEPAALAKVARAFVAASSAAVAAVPSKDIPTDGSGRQCAARLEEREQLVRVLACVLRGPCFEQNRDKVLQVVSNARLVPAFVASLPMPRIDLITGTVSRETVALTPLPENNRSGSSSVTLAGNVCACLLNLIETPPGPLAAQLVKPWSLQPLSVPFTTAGAAAGGVERLLCLFATAGDGPVRRNAAICLARLARDPEYRERIARLRGMEMLRQAGAQLAAS